MTRTIRRRAVLPSRHRFPPPMQQRRTKLPLESSKSLRNDSLRRGRDSLPPPVQRPARNDRTMQVAVTVVVVVVVVVAVNSHLTVTRTILPRPHTHVNSSTLELDRSQQHRSPPDRRFGSRHLLKPVHSLTPNQTPLPLFHRPPQRSALLIITERPPKTQSTALCCSSVRE